MSEQNGNGHTNGNGNSHENWRDSRGRLLKNHPPLPGGGRPKGPSVAKMLREVLEEGGEEVFKIRARKILESSERDSDAVKVMELFRKAIDGDKLDITKREPFEVQFEREAALADLAPGSGVNRLPSGANGHSDDGA